MVLTRLCARCLTDWPATRMVRYVDRVLCELCIRAMRYPAKIPTVHRDCASAHQVIASAGGVYL